MALCNVWLESEMKGLIFIIGLFTLRHSFLSNIVCLDMHFIFHKYSSFEYFEQIVCPVRIGAY